MRRTGSGLHPAYHETPSPDVFEVLAELGARASHEPEALEKSLERMARGLRESLGLRALAVEADTRSGRLRIVAGDEEAGDGSVVEFPILRGRLLVGRISAHPLGLVGGTEVGALRAAASVASLAIRAADACEDAAERTAQGSVIQLASEAMSRLMDEGQLYETVLVFALELLRSSAGAIFHEDGRAASVGFAGREEKLRLLEEVRLSGRQPWMGRVRGGHALGVQMGRSGGAIFLLRESGPYTVAEGVSLKLVARQLAWARERSQLHAALEQTGLEAIKALAAALESRDGTTGDHIRRTELLAERVAVGLGLDPDDVRAARYAAVLHDIGKIGIPDAILNKPGKLTAEEWEVMKRHPAIGADILARIAGFERVARAVRTHHEMFDGRGYPEGMAGAIIPVEARIVSVVDAYDAMTNDRPYRKAMSHEEAVEQIESGSGSQFDPAVVEVTKAILTEKEEGYGERGGKGR